MCHMHKTLQKKSQRNGLRKMPYRPKSKPDGKKSGGKKSCIWCNRDAHPGDKCPAKDATCTFCGKQGHYERACLQMKEIDKSTNLQAKSKHQLALGIDPDEDSSEYVILHGKTVNKVNACTRHARTLKQKIRVSTR